MLNLLRRDGRPTLFHHKYDLKHVFQKGHHHRPKSTMSVLKEEEEAKSPFHASLCQFLPKGASSLDPQR